MFVVVGNNHIFKKLEWQDQFVNKNNSIREHLYDFNPYLKMFSIGQIIGKSVFQNEFRERFGDIEGAVALDLDEWFEGWELGIVQSVAIKPSESHELLD